jgi:hypothetical protein
VVGGKLLGSPRQITARRGLGVPWTGVENHPPEPPGLGRVASLLGQNGEVAKGEVAVDSRSFLLPNTPKSWSTSKRTDSHAVRNRGAAVEWAESRVPRAARR